MTAIAASALAMIGFDISIYIDGIINLPIHHLAENIFSPLVFMDPDHSTYVSLVSAALAHTFIALVIVFSMLYLTVKNRKLFIICYVTVLLFYIVYELAWYEEIPNLIYLFAADRFLFQSSWLIAWFVMKPKLSQPGTQSL